MLRVVEVVADGELESQRLRVAVLEALLDAVMEDTDRVAEAEWERVCTRLREAVWLGSDDGDTEGVVLWECEAVGERLGARLRVGVGVRVEREAVALGDPLAECDRRVTMPVAVGVRVEAVAEAVGERERETEREVLALLVRPWDGERVADWVQVHVGPWVGVRVVLRLGLPDWVVVQDGDGVGLGLPGL